MWSWAAVGPSCSPCEAASSSSIGISDLGFVDEPHGQRGLTPAAVPVWPPATTPPSALVAHTATITHLCKPTSVADHHRPGEPANRRGNEGDGRGAPCSGEPAAAPTSQRLGSGARQRGSGEQARQGRGGGAQVRRLGVI